MADNSTDPATGGNSRGQTWVWIVLFVVVIAVGGGLVYYTTTSHDPTTETSSSVGGTGEEAAGSASATGQLDRTGDGTGDQAGAAAVEDGDKPARVVDLTGDGATASGAATDGAQAKDDSPGAGRTGDPVADQELAARKARLGLKESVQSVVTEDESIRVGERVIPMERIASAIRSRKRQVKEESLGGTGATDRTAEARQGDGVDLEVKPQIKFPAGQAETAAGAAATTGQAGTAAGAAATTGQAGTAAGAAATTGQAGTAAGAATTTGQAGTVAAAGTAETEDARVVAKAVDRVKKEMGATSTAPRLYGVRVARSGDNLWDIHFNVLKEYFGHRGIEMATDADQPVNGGRSSGVGRILKFAERMAYVYSAKEDKLYDNLDYLLPEDLVIVFDMTRLDNILSQLDRRKISMVRFDGTNLYLE